MMAISDLHYEKTPNRGVNQSGTWNRLMDIIDYHKLDLLMSYGDLGLAINRDDFYESLKKVTVLTIYGNYEDTTHNSYSLSILYVRLCFDGVFISSDIYILLCGVEGELMRLELVFDSTVDPFKRYGFNIDEILRKLKILKDMGIDVKLIDVAGWTRDMLYELYFKATNVAVRRGYKGYRLRKIFGSARDSGKYFGREIPALLVYDDSGKLIDVYPHEEKGRVITISEFLDSLLVRFGGDVYG